jgi:hypothetical protein
VPLAALRRALIPLLDHPGIHDAAAEAVTPRELQLWEQHMSHVADGLDIEAARTALSKRYAAMQAEGLRPPGPNAMQTFVTTGLDITRDEER